MVGTGGGDLQQRENKLRGFSIKAIVLSTLAIPCSFLNLSFWGFKLATGLCVSIVTRKEPQLMTVSGFFFFKCYSYSLKYYLC